MTGYTVHTGSNENFSSGWDRIFGGETEPEKAPKPRAKKKVAQVRTGKRGKSKARKQK